MVAFDRLHRPADMSRHQQNATKGQTSRAFAGVDKSCLQPEQIVMEARSCERIIWTKRLDRDSYFRQTDTQSLT